MKSESKVRVVRSSRGKETNNKIQTYDSWPFPYMRNNRNSHYTTCRDTAIEHLKYEKRYALLFRAKTQVAPTHPQTELARRWSCLRRN